MPKKNTILITGGAGFIGSNLCNYLINKNYQVLCLDNFDDFYPEQIKKSNINNLMNNDSFILKKGDIRDSDLLDDIFSKYVINAVIHLAAIGGVRNSISNPQKCFDINVNGSISLFEAMKKHKVKNLIFSSSSSVYGNKTGKLSELDRCDNQISPYAVSKRTIELLNYNYHINSNFNVINLRLFSIYGKNQRPDLVLHKYFNLIFMNKPIEIYGNSDSTRDYTHISDVVNAIYSSICYLDNTENHIYETINIGNDNPISLNTLIELVTQTISNKHIQILEKNFEKGDVTNTHANIDKARKLLKYTPKIKIEKGIELFYKWYQKK